MRLFFSVAIPEDVRVDLVRRLEPMFRIPGWVGIRPEAFHVTLRFIGEAPPNRVVSIEKAGAEGAVNRAFRMTVEGAGLFPDDRSPTVFWAGVGGEVAKMTAIAQSLERALVTAGLPAEDRRFTPHLTLGRARRGARMDSVGAAAFRECLRGYVSRSFDVKEIVLFRSHPGPAGPRYEIIRTFPLE